MVAALAGLLADIDMLRVFFSGNEKALQEFLRRLNTAFLTPTASRTTRYQIRRQEVFRPFRPDPRREDPGCRPGLIK